MLHVDANVVKRDEDEDGALLFHPDHDLIKTLNATGLFVFNQLDGRHDVDSIVDALVAAFEVDRDVAAEDVRRFVDELVRCHFAVPAAEVSRD